MPITMVIGSSVSITGTLAFPTVKESWTIEDAVTGSIASITSIASIASVASIAVASGEWPELGVSSFSVIVGAHFSVGVAGEPRSISVPVTVAVSKAEWEEIGFVLAFVGGCVVAGCLFARVPVVVVVVSVAVWEKVGFARFSIFRRNWNSSNCCEEEGTGYSDEAEEILHGTDYT